MSHEFHGSTGAADLRAVKHANAKKDVWYAVSLFASPDRKKDNVISTKAFYLDIDIKPDRADCYPSLLAGLNALASFIEKLELPTPTVVRSGNGLHVYWILKDAITPDKWLPVARALQLACVEENFLADGSITTDIARILRVPDTKNYKDADNPKPVGLFGEILISTYEEIETSLADFIFKVELRDTADAQNAKFATDLPSTPKDANVIADACGQMSLLRTTKGDLPEPQWYAGLGVLALCLDGEAIAHEWSRGYPKYSEAETAAKFERAREFAPTTCSKFYDTNPGICQKCPFYGKVVTPVQLGETVTPLVVESQALVPHGTIADVVAAAKSGIEHLIPRSYDCGKEGVYMNVKGETADDVPTRQRILDQPLWVSRVMNSEDGLGSEIEISWVDAKGKHRTSTIASDLLSNPPALDGTLRKRQIHFFFAIKQIVPYLTACINHVLHSDAEEEIVYDKFGFNADQSGFVVGNDVIRSDGRSVARISSRLDAKLVRKCGEKGSLEGWKNATSLFDQPQFWMHRFTILAALGTPLFAVAGNEGSILSLAGESSGGKTTAANVGISAYAHYDTFTIDPQSTMKSFYESWRQAGNLPVVINEASTLKREWMTPLALAAANGKARDTLMQDGRKRDAGTWQTLTILTSNTHLLDLPESVLNEASRRRMLELSFKQENLLPLSIGSPINKAIEKNYGVAGRLFLDFVMTNTNAVAESINAKVETLQSGVDSVHRYNVWLIATASVTADIATSLGLIDFETDDCIKNALGTLMTHAQSVESPLQKVAIAIADWNTRYQRDIGVKELNNDTAWLDEPQGEPRGRYNATNGVKTEFCIPIKQFRIHCLELGIDGNHIKQFMTSKGATERGVRLSRHSSNIKCYVMPHVED